MPPQVSISPKPEGERSRSAAADGESTEDFPEPEPEPEPQQHQNVSDNTTEPNGLTVESENTTEATPSTSTSNTSPSTPPSAAYPIQLKAPVTDSINGINGSSHPFSSPQLSQSIHVTPPKFQHSAKDAKDIDLLNGILAGASPIAAQQVLRENWRKFLFMSDVGDHDSAHLIYVLRAAIKHSPSNVLGRILKGPEFYQPEVVDLISKKGPVIGKVLRTATPSTIVSIVPEDVLDEAFEQRLRDMPANDIVRMLAKTDRLGYSSDDLIDPDDESVMPNLRYVAPQYVPMTGTGPPMGTFNGHHGLPVPSNGLAQPDRDPLLAEQERNLTLLREQERHAVRLGQERKAAAIREREVATLHSTIPPVKNILKGPKRSKNLDLADLHSSGPLTCPHCKSSLPTYAGYLHHTTRNVCQKNVPAGGYKLFCENCLAGFVGKQGIAYHQLNGVCRDGIVEATSPSSQLQGEAGAQPREPERPAILPPQYTPQAPIPPQQRRDSIQSQLSPGKSRMVVEIPLQTPEKIQKKEKKPLDSVKNSDEKRLYQSPSELPPQKLAEMKKQIADQEVKYQARLAAVPGDDRFPTAEDKASRYTSLKNSHATSCSIIRRKYGVTLRMRDKDKRKLAKEPVARPAIEAFRRTSTSGPNNMNGTPTTQLYSSPVVSGFSPVNAPGTNGLPTNYSPSYGQPHLPPYHSAFAVAHQSSPYTPSPDLAPSFQHPNQSQPTSNKHYEPLNDNPAAKRQRTDPPTTSAYFPPPQGGMSMVQVESEDAAAHIASLKKVPVAKAQAQWKAFNGTQNHISVPQKKPRGRPPTQPIAVQAGDDVIMISSSESEGDGEIPAKVVVVDKSRRPGSGGDGPSPDQPLPSIEGNPTTGSGESMEKSGGLEKH